MLDFECPLKQKNIFNLIQFEQLIQNKIRMNTRRPESIHWKKYECASCRQQKILLRSIIILLADGAEEFACIGMVEHSRGSLYPKSAFRF